MNVIADHYRMAHKPHESIELIDEDHPLHKELAVKTDDKSNLNQEFLECLLPLIDHLPSPYREAVRLADIIQIPQQEIAKRMGLSLSGAKSRIQRGREKLRAMILEMCEIEHDRYGNITHCQSHL